MLEIIKGSWLVIFAMSVLLLAGCKSEDEKMEDLLIGSWSCTSQIPASAEAPSASAKMDIQYLRSNKSSAHTVLSFSQDGATIDLEMLASGTWAVADGNLEEDITRVTLMGVRGPGGAFSMPELPGEVQRELHAFADAFKDLVVMTEIREISESRLDLLIR